MNVDVVANVINAPISFAESMPMSADSQSIRFHLSLNVTDLPKSVAFFQAFFGREPAKFHDDYAKFEIDDPPLVLSLEPCASDPASTPRLGNMNHAGLRMPDSVALVEAQRRLEIAGISTRREEGIECCYARQTKFWVHDPDGNLWEVYTLDEDIERRGDGRLADDITTSDCDATEPPPAIWRHRLGEPFPPRLPILDRTVDVVQLEGTLNEKRTDEAQHARLREVLRILRSGGRVELHLLVADREITQLAWQLPGPAARVQAVPVERDVIDLLAANGFTQVEMTFRGHSPCFRLGDCELREGRYRAFSP